MRTKNQKYSDKVFQNIQTLVNSKSSPSDKKLRKYKSLCKRAGGVMRTVGLIQFLTFLQAKGKKDSEKHHEYLLEDLQKEANEFQIVLSNSVENFLDKVRKQELPEYMQTTKEILRLLQWHKRISEILIEGTADDGDEI